MFAEGWNGYRAQREAVLGAINAKVRLDGYSGQVNSAAAMFGQLGVSSPLLAGKGWGVVAVVRWCVVGRVRCCWVWGFEEVVVVGGVGGD